MPASTAQKIPSQGLHGQTARHAQVGSSSCAITFKDHNAASPSGGHYSPLPLNSLGKAGKTPIHQIMISSDQSLADRCEAHHVGEAATSSGLAQASTNLWPQ
jgi:hypothetical protein